LCLGEKKWQQDEGKLHGHQFYLSVVYNFGKTRQNTEGKLVLSGNIYGVEVSPPNFEIH
jgi:hypothetical protein